MINTFKFYFVLFLISFVSCNSNKDLIHKEHSELQFSYPSFRVNEMSFELGDKIQKAKNTFGEYSRSNSYLLLDSIFIWDNKGIAIITDKNNEWKIKEVYIFFNTLKTNNKENDNLFYKKFENNRKKFYKKNQSIIDENYFVNNEYASDLIKKKNKELMTQLSEKEKNMSYIYPNVICKNPININGVQFHSNDNIATFNKRLKSKNIELFTYELDLYKIATMEPELLMNYIGKKEYKTNQNYGVTDRNINGLYISEYKLNKSVSIMVSNNKIEYIKFNRI